MIVDKTTIITMEITFVEKPDIEIVAEALKTVVKTYCDADDVVITKNQVFDPN